MCNSVGFELQIEKHGDRGTIVFTATLKDGDRKLSVYVDADYPDKDNDGSSVSGAAVIIGSTSSWEY